MNQKIQWWVQRWLDLLDSYRFKKRLERGRNYAREGNVLSMDFVESVVIALVQGSEVNPYQVSLSLEPFPDEDRERILKTMSQPPFSDRDWQCIIDTISQKAIYSAKLLSGEMPANIEEVFTANGLSLFPYSLTDVFSRCSCPDKANPCKHIAAVYYQLSDRFSEEPFLIFRLRGRTKEEIIEGLRELRNQKNTVSKSKELSNKIRDKDKDKKLSKGNIENSEVNFWEYEEELESSLLAIVPPLENKDILEILGRIPLTSADADSVQQYLDLVYKNAREKALTSAIKITE